RELALRFLADETEEDLLEHLARYQTAVLWETSERILVPVTTAPGTSAIVRRASRMAWRIKADLHAVHVVMSDRGRGPDKERLDALRQLCVDVGADWTELEADDPAQAIVEYAKSRQITQIVIGSSQRSRFQELMGGGSTVRKVSRSAAAAGIDVHIIARRDEGEALERAPGLGEPHPPSEGETSESANEPPTGPKGTRRSSGRRSVVGVEGPYRG